MDWVLRRDLILLILLHICSFYISCILFNLSFSLGLKACIFIISRKWLRSSYYHLSVRINNSWQRSFE
jgi:hypothetical protein